MPELVTIPISFFEVTIDYEKANIRILGDRASLVQAIFEVLRPYLSSLDDIEVLTAGKPSEQGVLFKLPQKHISFFVGPTLCRFSRNAVDWDLAEETISILWGNDLLRRVFLTSGNSTLEGSLIWLL